MCGVVVARDKALVEAGIKASFHRGPDHSDLVTVNGWVLGHTRLSIVDLSSAGQQPMRRGQTTVVYNGEMWNHETLGSGFDLASTSDTEAVVFSLDQERQEALSRFDGQFGLCWVHDDDEALYAARDKVGEVPLHYGYHRSTREVMIASEMKALIAMGVHPATISWVPPGSVAVWTDPKALPQLREWHEYDLAPVDDDLTTATAKVDDLLADAVVKRCKVADVPVATLLSGGIDSSAVTWHALPYLPDLVAYTAVYYTDSLDRRCARAAADHLGIELIEVVIPPPSADDLSTVIESIEMPHKAQVEIGWACLHLARRLHDDGIRVVLSGEGSDELWSSYGRSFHTEQRLGWHKSRRQNVLGQHRKNYARVNKVFMAHSVEGRLPFADANLLEYALRLERDSVFGHHFANRPSTPVEGRKPTKEKIVLRDSYHDRLPERIERRDKSAFQTDAGIDKAAAGAVADPQSYYRREYRRIFNTKES